MSNKSIWDVDEVDLPRSPQKCHPKELAPVKLNPQVITSCKQAQFHKPNKLQLEALPFFADSFIEDIVIEASPRSGKTSSTVIGIMNNFIERENEKSVAVILSPTFEIAEAAYVLCQKFEAFCNVSVHLCTKGKNTDVNSKKRKAVFVGTPEKILDLDRSSVIHLNKVSFLVIDEADCLSNPTKYFKEVVKIHQKLPPKISRTVLCSTSMNNVISDFINERLYSPKRVTLKNDIYRQFPIQRICIVYDSRSPVSKTESVKHIFNMKDFQGQMVVFCETKEAVTVLRSYLSNENITAVILTGQLSISQKKEIIKDFSNGSIKLLITTRVFLNVLYSNNTIKLIHYDQMLNEKQMLDINAYKKREILFSLTQMCLEIFFIEDNWVPHLLGEMELGIEGSYLKDIEKISYDKLETFFN